MVRFPSLEELFEGRHLDREIIILCVRWYLRFKLSFRDLAEMLAERALSIALTTIMRWVHHYDPEFGRRWNRFAQPVGASWRVDETYVKVGGKWVYLYRAVDRAGNTVDFRLSLRRDAAAAKTFFRKAIKGQRSGPRSVTLDGYAASHCAVRELKVNGELPADTRLRSSKYLNYLIEQDHRGVKLRIGPMFGFKQFKTAAITIAGIELLLPVRKGSSISVGCVLGIDVRPLSGMQSWQVNRTTKWRAHCHNFCLVTLFAPEPDRERWHQMRRERRTGIRVASFSDRKPGLAGPGR